MPPGPGARMDCHTPSAFLKVHSFGAQTAGLLAHPREYLAIDHAVVDLLVL